MVSTALGEKNWCVLKSMTQLSLGLFYSPGLITVKVNAIDVKNLLGEIISLLKTSINKYIWQYRPRYLCGIFGSKSSGILQKKAKETEITLSIFIGS